MGLNARMLSSDATSMSELTIRCWCRVDMGSEPSQQMRLRESRGGRVDRTAGRTC